MKSSLSLPLSVCLSVSVSLSSLQHKSVQGGIYMLGKAHVQGPILLLIFAFSLWAWMALANCSRVFGGYTVPSPSLISRTVSVDVKHHVYLHGLIAPQLFWTLRGLIVLMLFWRLQGLIVLMLFWRLQGLIVLLIFWRLRGLMVLLIFRRL